MDEPDKDRVQRHANDALLPEERESGSAYPGTQAEEILAESDRTNRGPRRTAGTTRRASTIRGHGRPHRMILRMQLDDGGFTRTAKVAIRVDR